MRSRYALVVFGVSALVACSSDGLNAYQRDYQKALDAWKPDAKAFGRAPPRPANYDPRQLPDDLAGVGQPAWPGAPRPPAIPEPPQMDANEHLTTLDIVGIGLSIEMFRQGNVWNEVKKATSFYENVLPADGDERWEYTGDLGVDPQRQAQVLEMALYDAPEAWPIPAVAVFEPLDNPLLADWTDRLFEEHKTYLDEMRMPAGLHWSKITQIGTVYDSTPEGVIEAAFRTFERHPDLPLLLIYMRGRSGGPDSEGRRRLTDPTGAHAAIVLARRERVEWLRPWAPYTRPAGNPLYPGFYAWDATPPKPFKPTPFFPTPWTRAHFKQWDAMPTLATLHRPVVARLTDGEGHELKRNEREAALLSGWKGVTSASAPARVFFDAGKPGAGLAALAPILREAGSDLELTDPQEGIDVAARLGDTGAAAPFVSLALATMATAESGEPSIVVPLRKPEEATFFLITPTQQQHKDRFEPKILPNQSTQPDAPAPAPPTAHREPTLYIDRFAMEGHEVDPIKALGGTSSFSGEHKS